MKTKSDFIKKGVLPEKILATHKLPCFIWNVDEMKIVNKMSETHEIAEVDGRMVLRIKPGNMMVNAITYSEINDFIKDQINISEGIVVIETDYSEHFRMAFVGRDAEQKNRNIKNYYDKK